MSSGGPAHIWCDRWETPLGVVSCELRSALALTIEPQKATVQGVLQIKREIFDLPKNWNGDPADIGMRIDGGRCWRWYFECSSPTVRTDIQLFCGIKEAGASPWYGDTGENFASVESARSGVAMHIGTEDDQLLPLRIWDRDGYFPLRYQRGLRSVFEEDWSIDLGPSGILIGIPPLEPGDRLYCHLLAAYKKDAGLGNGATNSAVDRHMESLDAWLSEESAR